ncbi:MAG: L-histidine N(alpha)-methyltransferase [Labilithrix sp.]|nr:L-histidine N(alpha)-methyltransferase [Labilithrix sp.]
MAATFLADVVAGLARSPKSLPARYMFDGVGARLFACLAGSHDHHLTRSELAILDARGAEIGAAIGQRVQLVDLACGDGLRTSILAAHLTSPARIAVVDRVAGAATRAATTLGASHPELPILALDAQDAWSTRVPSCANASRTVAYLPASIIGELEPREAKNELRRLATECGPDAGLLVAVDLKKDAAELERAYADRAGVAASFTLNLLARINRELGGSFQLAAFDHRATYEAVKGRVELQLVSKRWQWAAVHGHWFNFGPGEAVTTLVAYKYTLEWFSSLAGSAGWNVEHVFMGDDRKYALVLLRTPPSAR